MLLVVVGDNIVDLIVERGLASIGGNCLNVAVHLHRLGVPARYVGSVGDDAAGHWLLQSLAAEGLDTSAVTVVPAGTTGYATIHHRDGEREFGDFDRGASQLRVTEEQWRTVAQGTLIHTSYSSVLEDQLPRLAAVAPVSFDFDTHVDDEYAAALVPHVTHAFFSGAGRDVAQLDSYAHRLLADGTQTVTITRGADGALHWRADGRWSHPARSLQAVDTLGAGDAHIARMLVGISRDEAPQDTLAAAAELAAEVCSTLGALGLNTTITLPDNSHDREKEIAR